MSLIFEEVEKCFKVWKKGSRKWVGHLVEHCGVKGRKIWVEKDGEVN